MDVLLALKDYIYVAYLAAIGYLGWNHKRLDTVINESKRLGQEVSDLQKDIEHIRNGVDKLTYHLLDRKK